MTERETVMLGLSARITVTLVVSMAPDPMPDVGTCCETGRDEGSGAPGLAGWPVVTPMLAGASVGGARGRLEAATPGAVAESGLGGAWDNATPHRGCCGGSGQ